MALHIEPLHTPPTAQAFGALEDQRSVSSSKPGHTTPSFDLIGRILDSFPHPPSVAILDQLLCNSPELGRLESCRLRLL